MFRSSANTFFINESFKRDVWFVYIFLFDQWSQHQLYLWDLFSCVMFLLKKNSASVDYAINALTISEKIDGIA